MIIKLVRDKIPNLIREDGKIPETRIADRKTEMSVFLYQKMIEELGEYFKNPSIEEAADMFEVLLGICYNSGFEWKDVVERANHKRATNGAFDLGIILTNVNEVE
jgi:predicted house-cleaning noncanonical NTP pyrophosphatase (MazG superfamily)